MGVLTSLGTLTRAGEAVRGVARVFRADASEGQSLEHEAQRAALTQMAAEFAVPSATWFDRLVDGLNRLPRPLLAFGTLGLFVYAMIDPWAFAGRMKGLAYVPEPLWWLLGAIVGFYFGARELHYVRKPRSGAGTGAPGMKPVTAAWHHADAAKSVISATVPTAAAEGSGQDRVAANTDSAPQPRGEVAPEPDDGAGDHNAALADWLAGQS